MGAQTIISAEKIGPFPHRPFRTPMLAHVDIFGGGMHLGAIQLHNLSSGGLGGSGFALDRRKKLAVQLSGIGEVFAQLVWVNKTYFGLAFDHHIHVAAFDLGGPASGVRPSALGTFGNSQFHATEHDHPLASGGGGFVGSDGAVIPRYCD